MTTSPYLEQPKRTEAQARADDRNARLNRLHDYAESLPRQANQIRQSSGLAEAESQARRLETRHSDLHWLMDEYAKLYHSEAAVLERAKQEQG